MDPEEITTQVRTLGVLPGDVRSILTGQLDLGGRDAWQWLSWGSVTATGLLLVASMPLGSRQLAIPGRGPSACHGTLAGLRPRP